MNHDFLKVISASEQARQGLVLATASRLGTPIQNVEKDFWVTWTLDLLFNGRQENEPRRLLKTRGDSMQRVRSGMVDKWQARNEKFTTSR